MNGFTNAILSLLLSWIRLFINQMWHLLNSTDGNSFLSFLAANWKILVVILCVGGFIADRIIYLFRWRPYYVWRSRRLRRRREREAGYQPINNGSPQEEPEQDRDTGFSQASFGNSPAPQPYMPPQQASLSQTGAPQPYAPPSYTQATSVYQNPIVPMQTLEAGGATIHYAPVAHNTAASHVPYAQPYVPPQDLSPVFDDDLSSWEQGDTLVKPMDIKALAHDMDNSFGAAMPEPLAYLRDMQAGFARPLPPEQLYSPAAAPVQPAEVDDEPAYAQPSLPVHPGLDMANFRRNIGLTPAGSLNRSSPQSPENDDAPAYAATRNLFPEAAQPTRSHHPFANLAKKARGFVGVDGDDDTRSIHDLQPAVDLRTAFHEPVYPKPKNAEEDDDLSTY